MKGYQGRKNSFISQMLAFVVMLCTPKLSSINPSSVERVGSAGEPRLHDALLGDLLLSDEASDGEHSDAAVVELGVLVLKLLLGVGREEVEGVPAVVAGDGVGLHLEGVALGGIKSLLCLEVDGGPLLGGDGSLGGGDKDEEGDEGPVVEPLELRRAKEEVFKALEIAKGGGVFVCVMSYPSPLAPRHFSPPGTRRWSRR